jgi:hypothetical protein
VSITRYEPDPPPECLAGRSLCPWTRGTVDAAVQAQLGHASATVTLDRYGHLFPDELQQLADRLQDAYAEASTDPARTEAAEAMLRQRKEAGQ